MILTPKQIHEVETTLNSISRIFNLRRVPPLIGYCAVTILRRQMLKTEPALAKFDRQIAHMESVDDDGNDAKAWGDPAAEGSDA